MPRYQFACSACETTFEEKRSFSQSDEPAACPACEALTTEKVIGAAMFFAPGSAAKAMLEPKASARAVPTAHAGGCPCCSGRSGTAGGTVI